MPLISTNPRKMHETRAPCASLLHVQAGGVIPTTRSLSTAPNTCRRHVVLGHIAGYDDHN